MRRKPSVLKHCSVELLALPLAAFAYLPALGHESDAAAATALMLNLFFQVVAQAGGVSQ